MHKKLYMNDWHINGLENEVLKKKKSIRIQFMNQFFAIN